MISELDVLDILDRLEIDSITVWMDGGWGIDALVGRQTRSHDDLDVVIAIESASAAERALADLGFHIHVDEQPTRFVLRDHLDRRIDFHTVSFAETGEAVQILQDGVPWTYPAEGFTGKGTIGGRSVHCISTAVQLLCHIGYEPDADDRRDMDLLSRELGLVLPPPYGP